MSERNWLVHLRAVDTSRTRTLFTFPTAKVADATIDYKRYADADIVPVASSVALAGVALGPSHAWRWWALGGVLAVILVVGVAWAFRRRTAVDVTADAAYRMPHLVNAFTVLALLQRIKSERGTALVRPPLVR